MIKDGIGRTRVLIIDDEFDILSGLRRSFSRLETSLDIYFAQGAKEAFQLAEEVPPDVIVSDIGMAEMHGSELLAHFAVLYPEALRIAFSGHFDAAQINSVTPCPHHYISKPCGAERLSQTIISLMKEDTSGPGSAGATL